MPFKKVRSSIAKPPEKVAFSWALQILTIALALRPQSPISLSAWPMHRTDMPH